MSSIYGTFYPCIHQSSQQSYLFQTTVLPILQMRTEFSMKSLRSLALPTSQRAALEPKLCPWPASLCHFCRSQTTISFHSNETDTNSFFKKIILFFCFWLCWVFVAALAFLQLQQRALLSEWPCMGFSLWWLLLLSTGSRVGGLGS